MHEVATNTQNLQNKIYTVRGMQIMLDSDLASLYQVETKQLNKAVNRNLKRFPKTFRFQLGNFTNILPPLSLSPSTDFTNCLPPVSLFTFQFLKV